MSHSSYHLDLVVCIWEIKQDARVYLSKTNFVCLVCKWREKLQSIFKFRMQLRTHTGICAGVVLSILVVFIELDVIPSIKLNVPKFYVSNSSFFSRATKAGKGSCKSVICNSQKSKKKKKPTQYELSLLPHPPQPSCPV